MGNAVTHFEIVGADARLLQAFYEQAFDWQLKLTHPEYAMALTGNAGINGGVGALAGGLSHVTVYIDVDDVQGTLERIGRLGGATVMPALEIPGGPTIALFSDPEGHVLGIAKRPVGDPS